jgi:flavin reductase (DIM6/NTAB) family NADH-FMN oxidoreductase RutF
MPLDTDQQTFRQAMGRFATGVCVLSTRHQGCDVAVTVNAFMSVSLDPLLVLASLRTGGSFHGAVTQSGLWAVSILSAGAHPIATALAKSGRPAEGQLLDIPFTRGVATDLPLIRDAAAWLECSTQTVQPAGDHTLFIGRVLSVALGPGDTDLLTHYRGRYHKACSAQESHPAR